MQLNLTPDEARYVLHHLSQWITHLDNELVHTDYRDLKRSLSRDVEQLRALYTRFQADVESVEMQGRRAG